MVRINRRTALLSGAAALLAPRLSFAAGDDPLAAAFRNPPPAARPRVWWHWMNGNVTTTGIDADFAWMKRVGIAGVQNFDAAFNTPQVVDKRLAFLSPEWRDAFRHAVTQADRQGLEFAIAGSPGWSESGGPWVKPEQAMKKLVWSETLVDGGRPFAGKLPAPPLTTGPFQDIPGGGTLMDGIVGAVPSFYKDALVLAVRASPAEVAQPGLKPKVTASAAIDTAALTDGDRARTVDLTYEAGAESWVQFEYAQPQTMRAMTITAVGVTVGFGQYVNPEGRIEASDDGVAFRKVADFTTGNAPQRTTAFPAATARIFRAVFKPRQGQFPVAQRLHKLAELSFVGAPRVHRFEDKAGWSAAPGLESAPTPASDGVVRASEVIDLTTRLRPDGALDWTPPSGQWLVLRLGYSLTGRQNHPASVEGTGLEVDKLNRQHVKAYVDAYLGEYEKTVGPGLMGARGVSHMIIDSYEAGYQNWTDDMAARFKARRGYDLQPWAAALTGRIIDSAEATDAFLWDFRRTIGELMEDEHYGQISESLHARGMKRYGEAQEDNRVMLADGMGAKKTADIPMGATWASATDKRVNYDADIRETAAVAHIYGQNIAAAESLTAAGNNYGYSPETLKPVADRMMSHGLNRFVIHTSVHQPVDRVGPGIGLGPFGQWFTRNETWAEQAGPWLDYLSRSSHLLQQGRFVADVVWFYGQDTNITNIYNKTLPALPDGFAYDLVNADALVNVLKPNAGRLTTASGMSYRLLVIDPSVRRFTLPVLRQIRDAVAAGVKVAGPRPLGSPSRADDAAEFARLVDELWGQGKVAADAASALVGVAPDFKPERPVEGVSFVHRALADGDLYFIVNGAAEPRSFEASFRVKGKAPELWRADTGETADLGYRSAGDLTAVPLDLAANDAVFVMFRKPATAAQRTVVRQERVETTLGGPWTVRFQAGRGAPAQTTLPALTSWSDHADAGVRYFSGTGAYGLNLSVPAAWKAGGRRVILDLGVVMALAEVTVGGKSVGVAWRPPFQVDITDAVRVGDNAVEIRVTNLWPNRMIGDKQPGATKITFATNDPFKADSPLLPSGLLGPVRVLTRS